MDDNNSKGKRMVSESISEATPVKIGLVITFVGVLSTCVWFASAQNSKLDTVLKNQTEFFNTLGEMKTADALMSKIQTEDRMASGIYAVQLKSELAVLQGEVKKLQTEGSPILEKRITAVERTINELK